MMNKLMTSFVTVLLIATAVSAAPIEGTYSNSSLGVTDFYGTGKVTSLSGGSFGVGDTMIAASVGGYWSKTAVRTAVSHGDFIDNGDNTGHRSIFTTRSGTMTIMGDKLWGQAQGTSYAASFQQTASGTNYYKKVDGNWTFDYGTGSISLTGDFNNEPFTITQTSDYYIDTIRWAAGNSVREMDVQGNNSVIIITALEDTNEKPQAPGLIYPPNGSTDISLTPTLTTGAFIDPDAGDTHQQTEWAISATSDFSSSVFFETSTTHLTSMTVPVSLLQGNVSYFWRARFYDQNANVSDWSSAFSFTTEQNFTDINENGIPDTLENKTADLNNDGTADIDQTDVIKTLDTVVGAGQIGLSIEESGTVTQTVEINSIDPDSISKYQRPHTMPLGMLSFKLNVTNPGDTAYVKMYFSKAAPEDASWFFHDSVDGWSDYTQYATFSEDRKSASIQLKDGGHGDSDGVANGVIVDPCGFGIASWLKGKISDTVTSEGVTTSSILFPEIDLTLNALSDGTYISMLLPGTYNMDVTASGYQAAAFSDISIPETDIVTKDIQLTGRCKITGLEVTGTPSVSNPVKIIVNARSGSEIINYRYSVHDGYGTAAYDGTSWRLMGLQEYQTDNHCNYVFPSRGKSIIVAWATSSDADSVDPTGIPILGWSVDTSDSDCITNFSGLTITGDQKVNEKNDFHGFCSEHL